MEYYQRASGINFLAELHQVLSSAFLMNLPGGSNTSSKSRRTFSGSSRSRASSRNSFQPVIVDDKNYSKFETCRKQEAGRKNIDMDIVGGQRGSGAHNYILMNVNSPNVDSLTKVPWSVQVTTNPELCINLSPLHSKNCIFRWIALVIVVVAAIVGTYFYIVQRKRFRYPYYW